MTLTSCRRAWISGTVALVVALPSLATAPMATTAPSPVLSSSPAAPARLPGTPAPGKPPPPLETRVLRVIVDGRPPMELTPASLQLHPPLSTTQAGGKMRLVPLRALLASLVGPGARLAAVRDAFGGRAIVDGAFWATPTVVPVVWTNRRGLFKVGFVDDKGRRLPDSVEYRDVVELAVVVDR